MKLFGPASVGVEVSEVATRDHLKTEQYFAGLVPFPQTQFVPSGTRNGFEIGGGEHASRQGDEGVPQKLVVVFAHPVLVFVPDINDHRGHHVIHDPGLQNHLLVPNRIQSLRKGPRLNRAPEVIKLNHRIRTSVRVGRHQILRLEQVANYFHLIEFGSLQKSVVIPGGLHRLELGSQTATDFQSQDSGVIFLEFGNGLVRVHLDLLVVRFAGSAHHVSMGLDAVENDVLILHCACHDDVRNVAQNLLEDFVGWVRFVFLGETLGNSKSVRD